MYSKCDEIKCSNSQELSKWLKYLKRIIAAYWDDFIAWVNYMLPKFPLSINHQTGLWVKCWYCERTTIIKSWLREKWKIAVWIRMQLLQAWFSSKLKGGLKHQSIYKCRTYVMEITLVSSYSSSNSSNCSIFEQTSKQTSIKHKISHPI